MHLRLAGAAFVALMSCACSGAFAQSQDPPRREQQNIPTPIREFSDAVGQWHGWIDLNVQVIMIVGPDGMVKFRGPRDLTQQAAIMNDRLVVLSRGTDLDCGIMNGFLTCHARFGTWFAELNLRKL